MWLNSWTHTYKILLTGIVFCIVVKNEFWLVNTILRVKKHKTCKIEFKTRKPVKLVKPDQTRKNSVQPVKNVKIGLISRFLLKWKTSKQLPFSSLPFPLSTSPVSTHPFFCFTLSPFPFPQLTSGQANWEIGSTLHSPLTSSASDFTRFDSPLTRTFLARRR